jgi:ABC-type transport system involved in multi-copper enzyme maturation permease subunit
MFFALAALMGFAAGGAFNGVTVSFGFSNKVFLNSSAAITGFLSLLSAFSLFITAPAFGQAVVKDYAHQFDQIIYSAPVNRVVFLLSRFLAALVFMTLVLTSMGLGLWVSTVLPFVLKTSITTNHLINYVWPYVLIVIPNLFVFGSIIFLIATKSKKMAPVYIVTILIFMGWLLSGRLLSEVDNKMIASLLDPFGINALGETTKYWSADQQNARLVGLEGYLLYNRLAWLALGLVCFIFSLTSFKFTSRIAKAKTGAAALPLEEPKLTLPKMSLPNYSYGKMFGRQLRFEYKQIFRSIYFQTLVLAGICYMFVAGQNVGHMFGTNTLPVTYMILDFVGGSFDLFIIIILTFFAGEVVWRDRDQKTQQIIDSYPVPNLVLIGAKYLTLVGVVATLFLSVIFCGVLIQAFSGYTNFELPLYFRHLYGIRLLSFINIISLVFFIQVITNNKYLAHGLTVLYYILYTWAPSMGFEHKLYNFNAAPAVNYSDMNGYGHFLTATFMFRLYWLALSTVLMILAVLFWQRGNLTDFKDRLHELRRRNTPVFKGLMVLALAVFLGMGSYLFYNTNVLNVYTRTKDSERRQADYELKYAGHRYDIYPEIVAVNAKVDLFPETPSAHLEYGYTLKNKTSKPISEAFINVPTRFDASVKYELAFEHPTTLAVDDTEAGVRIYRFTPPIAPGEEVKMKYVATFKSPGIGNKEWEKKVINNGTFFNQSTYSIEFGYDPESEIKVNKTRAKYKLPERKRVPDISDAKERNFNALSRSASWIDFEATVSTSPDQIAIAPGYLQKTWDENGRKYFHYKMDKKMLNFYSFLSGRFKVRKEKWNDVNIEIYYHPGHEYNVDKMVDASKSTLEYFTKNFGPYQFTQYRVIEFPRYAGFAQSFPNTVPFSESIGFIAKVNPDNPKDVDFPFFITAHELAHQWWGHQVIPAGVQGAYFPTESFAEYTALLVMEKKYGHEKMKRFLREELETYLFGRQQENEYESPLSLAEGQTYVHYQKGSLALFALKEYVGEDVVNGAIKEFLNKVKFQEAPYTVSTEFIDILKRHVPVAQLPLVSDLLEKIVIFENRPVTADYKKLDDGKYEVHLKVNSAKMYADKNGKEVPTDFAQTFDVGVMDAKGDYLYLKKHNFTQGDNDIVIQVNKEPAKAGVDPLNYIIDRTPDDNIMNVSKASEEKKAI